MPAVESAPEIWICEADTRYLIDTAEICSQDKEIHVTVFNIVSDVSRDPDTSDKKLFTVDASPHFRLTLLRLVKPDWPSLLAVNSMTFNPYVTPSSRTRGCFPAFSLPRFTRSKNKGFAVCYSGYEVLEIQPNLWILQNLSFRPGTEGKVLQALGRLKYDKPNRPLAYPPRPVLQRHMAPPARPV